MAYTLEISPDFTVEDIHRIREQNYERTDAEEQIERLRAKRN